MAQKTICDICKRDITPQNKTENITYKGVDFQIGMTLDVERCPDADVCRHCTIDAFIAQDDRPKEAEVRPGDPLPWALVSTGAGDVIIARFTREPDAVKYNDSIKAKGGKGHHVRYVP